MNYLDIQLKAAALHGTNTCTTDELSGIQNNLTNLTNNHPADFSKIVGFVRTSDLSAFREDSVIQHWLEKAGEQQEPYLGKVLNVDFYQVDDLPQVVLLGLFHQETDFE